MKESKESTVIQIRGARTHNLKNINLDIPIGKITCFAGPSGSGKSSLAFHTLMTESKRRFINSLPTEMKFFWELSSSVNVDSISPVLPVWGLPQHNPMLNSRPVSLDVIGGHERLQRIFMVMGEYLCPKHHSPFEKVSSYEAEIKKISKKINLEEDVAHVFCLKNEYLKHVSKELMPSRSYQEEIRPFDSNDMWYELYRVKGPQLESSKNKFNEFNLSPEAPILIALNKSTKTFEFENKVIYKCPHCSESVEKVKEENLETLSPLNALGACSYCEGHGANLVYDRDKLVKDPTKSLKEGAVNFLSFSHFLPLLPTFLREAKKAGFDVDVPFESLPDSIWTFLYEGAGKYEGFNSYFEYLKSLRYKKTIRIYSRSLQSEVECQYCEGTRINETAGKLSLIVDSEVITFKDFLKLNFDDSLNSLLIIKKNISQELVRQKINSTFSKLEKTYKIAIDLGLGHIQNTRKVKTLSTSEYQRILLSKYLTYEGSQSLFVLDEPSLGLSLKTQKQVMKYLEELKDQGNTILLVEHSEYLKSQSDHIVLMGPGAGELGGEIVYQGKYKPEHTKLNFSPLKKINIKKFIEINDVKIRGIHKKNIKIAKSVINWVTGESGSGKSSVIIDVLANEVHKTISGKRLSFANYEVKSIKNANDFSDVIIINSSVDRISSRSTLGTFTDLGVYVRRYFANLPVSKSLGLKDGHFSSNSELGQCSSCEGRGVKTVEMHFMEDVEFVCEDCQGKKLKPFYADISDGQMTAYEAFKLPISIVLNRIKLTPKGLRIFEYFKILKLDYLNLDRSLSSLSGGERQRLQLISLLDKKTEGALIIFENLTSGLSHHELPPLADLLNGLAKYDNTIIVIDQNPLLEQMAQVKIDFDEIK